MYSGGGQQQQTMDDGQGKMTFQYLVISTLIAMRNAKADGDLKRYWSLFTDVLRYLLPFVVEENRAKIQRDYDKLKAYERILDEDSSIHIDTKEELKTKARYQFAEDKTYYLHMALPNSGIYKQQEDGLISFDDKSIPYDVLARIIRASTGGTPGQTKAALDDYGITDLSSIPPESQKSKVSDDQSPRLAGV